MTKLVVVDTYTNPLDAHVARGLLESEGIPAILHSEHHVWSSWPFALALGGVRLQVAERHARDARAVLERQRSGEFEQALAEESGVPETRCPACGSADLRYTRSFGSTLLLLATFGLSGVIFPPRITGRQCNACHSGVPYDKP
jgi:putative signal transducing protein